MIGYDASKAGVFHVMARDGGQVRAVPAPGSGFIFQIANAYEEAGSKCIVVDAVEMPRLPIGAATGVMKPSVKY